jgi:hypothetical protein
MWQSGWHFQPELQGGPDHWTWKRVKRVCVCVLELLDAFVCAGNMWWDGSVFEVVVVLR